MELALLTADTKVHIEGLQEAIVNGDQDTFDRLIDDKEMHVVIGMFLFVNGETVFEQEYHAN